MFHIFSSAIRDKANEQDKSVIQSKDTRQLDEVFFLFFLKHHR